MNRIASLSVVGLFALVGCSSGMDQNSSIKVMSAALVGTEQAQSQLMASATSSSATLDGDVANPAGSGSAHVSGSAQQTANGWSSTFDISYAHWLDAASSITLDGSLHEDASFSSLDPPVGTAHLTGMLHASGAVSGDADFDLTVTYSQSGDQVSGSIGGNTIEVSTH